MSQPIVFQITWEPLTAPLTLTGYNIYLVNGASPAVTKSFLAFVNGIASSSYNYTGQDGVQYQFEVRATDGNTEGPALEIFYPDGRMAYSPTLLTPDGQPMMIARDSQYLSKEEYLNYATGMKSITATSPFYTSGALDSYLKAASAQVNRYCRRHFDVQTKDEIYPNVRIGTDYPKLITVFTQEKPIQNIISVNIQILKWYIPVALDYLQLDQEGGFYHIVPMLSAGYTAIPIPSAVLIDGLLGKIWTRYTFGYDVMPEEVKMATSLIATKLIALPSQNPVSASAVKFGRNFSLQWDKDNDPLMNMVKDMLSPYRKWSYGTPAIPM
jgi:hypothetical protein